MDDLKKGDTIRFDVIDGYLHAIPAMPVIFTAEFTGYINSKECDRGWRCTPRSNWIPKPDP